MFKQMLKVSASYLEKQKSFIPKKMFFGRGQYQNKKALFTDSIFWDGFGFNLVIHYISYYFSCERKYMTLKMKEIMVLQLKY